MDTLEIVTVIASGLFAGASIYINLVEHPARLSCGTAIAVKQWAPSYKRATVMQVSLALVATVAGIGRVTRWRRAAVVSRCSANLRRHSFHPHRGVADEQSTACTRTRSSVRRDAAPAGEMGSSPCCQKWAQPDGVRAFRLGALAPHTHRQPSSISGAGGAFFGRGSECTAL